ncbi:MAG: class I SAM-dependent methyltransferase [Lachnospiraceae bacterium]|nr:class I SAM-dependent methyltransferase [Lachnospiraceae bacterium]
MSNSYQSFAYVYDEFMEDIPYDTWSRYLCRLFQQYGVPNGTLVELGCGTGTLCLLMARSGYQIIGVDRSVDMLSVAASKCGKHPDITLIQQDMCQLDLGTQYDGCYCICDSLNYLLTPEDITAAFSSVQKHLRPNGIFLFDLKTPYFYETVLGDQVFCEHHPDCSYIWENNYFEEDRINQYELTFFVRQSQNALFERFCETHHQKAYSLTEIIDLLKCAGLQYVTSYNAFTTDSPSPVSERIYVVAQNRKDN